jgi:hypothetical protein
MASVTQSTPTVALRERLPLVVATAILVVTLGVLLWNAAQYPWLQSYDAYASWQYKNVVTHEHRLPRTDETDVWHNPPLFFVLAGQIERVAKHVGFTTPEHAVQFLSALCVLGIVVLAGLIARALFPRRRWIWVGAIAVAAITPVLVRAGSLYHPEPLATLLATAGLYVVVRALAKDELGWKAGLVAGLLLALANLTRTWALATVAAVLIGLCLRAYLRRDRSALVMAVVTTVVVAALTGPWFAYKAVEHGNPLAYSQPNPEQWRRHGRPASFWIGLSADKVFTRPYQPAFRNHLAPVLYADWWGDYWRVYGIPPDLHESPDTLPSKYSRPLVEQVWVGLWITVVALGGLVALVIRAVRRRDEALWTLLLALGLLAIAYTAFLWRYPKQDGDNIKALYVLNAVPIVAVAAGYALERLGRSGLFLLLGVVLATLVVAASTLSFVVLPRA